MMGETEKQKAIRVLTPSAAGGAGVVLAGQCPQAGCSRSPPIFGTLGGSALLVTSPHSQLPQRWALGAAFFSLSTSANTKSWPWAARDCGSPMEGTGSSGPGLLHPRGVGLEPCGAQDPSHW